MFETFREFWTFGKWILYCWCAFVLYFVIFNAFIGFCVVFCIYEHTLKIIFIFWKMTRSVNNFRTIFIFVIYCDLLWFVAPPYPLPWRQSKFPSRRNKYRNKCCFRVFFMKKELKSGTNMITSCSIRRVGPNANGNQYQCSRPTYTHKNRINDVITNG